MAMNNTSERQLHRGNPRAKIEWRIRKENRSTPKVGMKVHKYETCWLYKSEYLYTSV